MSAALRVTVALLAALAVLPAQEDFVGFGVQVNPRRNPETTLLVFGGKHTETRFSYFALAEAVPVSLEKGGVGFETRYHGGALVRIRNFGKVRAYGISSAGVGNNSKNGFGFSADGGTLVEVPVRERLSIFVAFRVTNSTAGKITGQPSVGILWKD